MKNIQFAFFFIILCSMSLALEAQEYVPFPDSIAVWKVVHHPYPPGPMISYSLHYDQYIEGDTMIDNLEYKKIYQLGYDPDCSLITYGPDYVGCYRNEINEKKIYFIQKNFPDEVLLYDFSLEIGDTVPETYINYNYPHLIVEHIDSVQVGDAYRKRFTYLEETWAPIMLIEGIGAHTGLLEPMEIFEHQHFLRCFHLEGELLYLNADSCNLETDTCISVNIPVYQLDGECFAIYPNPCVDHFKIEFYSESDGTMGIYIHSLIGTPVESITAVQVYTGSNSLRINCSDYTSGVYFINLRSSTFSKTLPFIKH